MAGSAACRSWPRPSSSSRPRRAATGPRPSDRRQVDAILMKPILEQALLDVFARMLGGAGLPGAAARGGSARAGAATGLAGPGGRGQPDQPAIDPDAAAPRRARDDDRREWRACGRRAAPCRIRRRADGHSDARARRRAGDAPHPRAAATRQCGADRRADRQCHGRRAGAVSRGRHGRLPLEAGRSGGPPREAVGRRARADRGGRSPRPDRLGRARRRAPGTSCST